MELLTAAFSVLKVDNNENSAKSKSTIFFVQSHQQKH